MKRFFFAAGLIASLFFAGCADGYERQDEFILKRFQAGKVGVGTAIEEVLETYGDKIKFSFDTSEGKRYPVAEVYLDSLSSRPSLILQLDEDSSVVYRIVTLDDNFKTSEGIGVGSVYKELAKNYTIQWVDTTEGNVIARVKNLRMSFVLDEKGIPPQWQETKNAKYIKPDTKIKKIVIY